MGSPTSKNLVWLILTAFMTVVDAGTKPPTRAPTPAPTMMPTEAPTNYQAPPNAAYNPGYFYAGVTGLVLVMFVFAEASARILMGWKRETGDDSQLNHEDINPDYKLESYILSILNVSKGVFSENNTLSRAWYEISCEHTWFSVFKSEVNGPAKAQTNIDEGADPNNFNAKFKKSKKGPVCVPQMASGTWNRCIRSLRLLTNALLAMTFIGLFYLKQHPQIDESMECYNKGTKEKCEDTYITFLDTVRYCSWYADADAPNWGEDSSHCYYDYAQASNYQVLILSVVLTAIIMGLLQWPMDIVFNSLLVAPKKSEYFNDDGSYSLGFMTGDHSRRLELLQEWNRADNLSSVEAQSAAGVGPDTPGYNPNGTMRDGDVKIPKACRDISDILGVMEKVSGHRAAIGNPETRKAFDNQWGLMPNYDQPELDDALELQEAPARLAAEGSGSQDYGANFHFAGIARAVDDEQYFDMEYILGINADLININETMTQKTMEALIRRRETENKIRVDKRHRKEKELEKDRIARKIEKYTDKAEWLKNKGTSKALDKLDEVETTLDIMRKEKEIVEHALAVASGEASAEADQKRQFFNAEQLEKDVFYSQAISEHIKKREEAAAVDEGNYLAAQPVRCSTGYIETSHLELRMGEAKKISEEICLQIKEAASTVMEPGAALNGDISVLETTVGHEILRFFAIDTMGGLQSQWARTYLQKVENTFRFNSLRRTALPGHVSNRLLLLILALNGALVAIGISEFYMSTWVWEQWWLIATAVYLVLDIVIFQTTAVLCTSFIIPNLAREQVMQNMNIVFPILCRLWKNTLGAQDVAHQNTDLSAPGAMYISRKIAETYPLVFESKMMLGYNTPWVYPMHEDNKTRIKGTDPVDEESHTHRMPTYAEDEVDEEELDNEMHVEKQSKPARQILLLRLGNFPQSMQRVVIYMLQPAWGFMAGYVVFSTVTDSSRYYGTIATVAAMLLYLPLSWIVLGITNSLAHHLLGESDTHHTETKALELPDEEDEEPEAVVESESEEEDEHAYSEDEVELPAEEIQGPETTEEKKEEMPDISEERRYAREHPEEELNQYSSEDDEAFAERVRMRMLANERKKAMRKKLKGAAKKAMMANKFRLTKAPPSASTSSVSDAESEISAASSLSKGKRSGNDSDGDRSSGGRSEDEDYGYSRKRLPKGFTAAKLRKARRKINIIRHMAHVDEGAESDGSAGKRLRRKKKKYAGASDRSSEEGQEALRLQKDEEAFQLRQAELEEEEEQRLLEEEDASAREKQTGKRKVGSRKLRTRLSRGKSGKKLRPMKQLKPLGPIGSVTEEDEGLEDMEESESGTGSITASDMTPTTAAATAAKRAKGGADGGASASDGASDSSKKIRLPAIGGRSAGDAKERAAKAAEDARKRRMAQEQARKKRGAGSVGGRSAGSAPPAGSDDDDDDSDDDSDVSDDEIVLEKSKGARRGVGMGLPSTKGRAPAKKPAAAAKKAPPSKGSAGSGGAKKKAAVSDSDDDDSKSESDSDDSDSDSDDGPGLGGRKGGMGGPRPGRPAKKAVAKKAPAPAGKKPPAKAPPAKKSDSDSKSKARGSPSVSARSGTVSDSDSNSDSGSESDTGTAGTSSTNRTGVARNQGRFGQGARNRAAPRMSGLRKRGAPGPAGSTKPGAKKPAGGGVKKAASARGKSKKGDSDSDLDSDSDADSDSDGGSDDGSGSGSDSSEEEKSTSGRRRVVQRGPGSRSSSGSRR